MATTGQNFILTGGTSSILVGTTVSANPQVLGLMPNQAMNACNAAPVTGSGVATGIPNDSATPLDRVIWDLAMTAVPPGIGSNLLSFGKFIGGYAKNGVLYITFTGTTAVNVDFTALATAVGVTSSQYGDTTLATLNALIMQNISASASTITVSEGGSNPLRFPNVLGGTTPTFAMALGDVNCQASAAGQTVDSTHKVLTLTPTAGGAFAIAYGGA